MTWLDQLEPADLCTGVTPTQLRDFHSAIYEGGPPIVYCGDKYVAASVARKEDVLLSGDECKRRRSHAGETAVGLGDSEADAPALGLQHIEGCSAYYGTYVGTAPLPPAQESASLLQTQTPGIEGTRAILKLLPKKMTNDEFMAEFKQLVKNGPDSSAPRVRKDGLFTLNVVYADKDGTMAEKEERIDPDMARAIVEILQTGARFVVLSSNRADELQKNAIDPVVDAVGRRYELLSHFEVRYANGLGRMTSHPGTPIFDRKMEGKPMLDGLKAMMFRLYTAAFLTFLRDPTAVLGAAHTAQDRELVAELQRIYGKLEQPATRLLKECKTYGEVKTAFSSMLSAYGDTFGGAPFLDTWEHTFATLETASCRGFLQGKFTRFAKQWVLAMLAATAGSPDAKRGGALGPKQT